MTHALRLALASLVPAGDVHKWSPDDVRERVALALERGAVHGVEAPRFFAAQSPKAEEAAPQRVALDPTLTWLSIRLVDDGAPPRPVPFCAYRVTMPDGSVHEGRLDDQGNARFDGIDSGNCKVEFPEIDASEWKKLG